MTSMTEEERIKKAHAWREAAAQRRDFAQEQMEAADNATDAKPDAWWDAQHAIVNRMWDRVQLIDALFPELGGVVDGKHT